NDTEPPIRKYLPSRKPLHRPGEKNRSGKTAFNHAVNVPTEHFGMLVLRMPDRVHAEFNNNKRMFTGEILQPQQVTFEIALIVKVNVETGKIGILREQIFGGRIRRIRK